MRRAGYIFVVSLLLFACGPLPPPINDETVDRYYELVRLRAAEFQSAAYLIDMRLNDAGRKFSTVTELYFSGDSVGFYGRGYLGKGAFKGHIINDMVTIYFKRQNEYFSSLMSDIRNRNDCPGPGEIMLLMLSRLSFKHVPGSPEETIRLSQREIYNSFGRFDRMIRLQGKRGIYPKLVKLNNPLCGDSVMIRFDSYSNTFPYYEPSDILYYNSELDFRARGFIREQKYNIAIKPQKFELDIPVGAARIESF